MFCDIDFYRLVLSAFKSNWLLFFFFLKEYLHSQQCIHGNIRAHSILVGSDLTAKLWGFGSLYRRSMQGTVGAVESIELKKWQAPEVLSRRAFSYSSDVWVFFASIFSNQTETHNLLHRWRIRGTLLSYVGLDILFFHLQTEHTMVQVFQGRFGVFLLDHLIMGKNNDTRYCFWLVNQNIVMNQNPKRSVN